MSSRTMDTTSNYKYTHTHTHICTPQTSLVLISLSLLLTVTVPLLRMVSGCVDWKQVAVTRHKSSEPRQSRSMELLTPQRNLFRFFNLYGSELQT